MEKGRIAHSPLFLLYTLKNQPDTRISAVTPKKVAKTAVGRNSIRRKIYESARTLGGKNGENFVPGIHAIVFAKPAMLKTVKTEIVTDLKNIFVKVGILR